MKILFFIFTLVLIEAKYEIILDRIEFPYGENDPISNQRSLLVRKFNRSTSVYAGVFEIKSALSNDHIVSFEAYNLSGGQYKKLFGHPLGGFCDLLYERSGEKDVRRAFAMSNTSSTYGSCPIPAQFIEVFDYTPEGAGDLLPPYIPGNERWKLEVWISIDDKIVSGLRLFAILRDNQKLFDSKW